MIDWDQILYGAALSAACAVAAVIALRERRVPVILSVAVAALVAPIGWNAVLRATHAREFFTDAPISVMPASWQDPGSGVVTLAVAAVLLGLGPLRAAPSRPTILLALIAGAAAFLVDVYLY